MHLHSACWLLAARVQRARAFSTVRPGPRPSTRTHQLVPAATSTKVLRFSGLVSGTTSAQLSLQGHHHIGRHASSLPTPSPARCRGDVTQSARDRVHEQHRRRLAPGLDAPGCIHCHFPRLKLRGQCPGRAFTNSTKPWPAQTLRFSAAVCVCFSILRQMSRVSSCSTVGPSALLPSALAASNRTRHCEQNESGSSDEVYCNAVPWRPATRVAHSALPPLTLPPWKNASASAPAARLPWTST